MASLSTLKNSAPFPESVSDQLKQIRSSGERQVKLFIQDRLLMQKTTITEQICKNKFYFLNIESTKSTSINLEVPYMNKLWSAVEHRPAIANEIFREENCRVLHCFSVDCTNQMFMAPRVQDKDYHHVRILSCQKHVKMS